MTTLYHPAVLQLLRTNFEWELSLGQETEVFTGWDSNKQEATIPWLQIIVFRWFSAHVPSIGMKYFLLASFPTLSIIVHRPLALCRQQITAIIMLVLKASDTNTKSEERDAQFFAAERRVNPSHMLLKTPADDIIILLPHDDLCLSLHQLPVWWYLIGSFTNQLCD